MSWMGRMRNLLRGRRLDDEIADEMAAHLEEAGERGRSADEARRAFGNALVYREQSRDLKLLPWLDSLVSDLVFGWRQLRKRPAVSAAAILSLALAIGATTAAYRLIDAVLLRKLPIANPERFLVAATTYVDSLGRPNYQDDFDYPSFVKYRDAVADRADLLLAGDVTSRHTVIFGSGAPERFYRQHVSGNLFPIFGLRPALGRLLTPDDDLAPGASPVAVISYDYWTRRFGRDRGVLGSTFRVDALTFTVVGVGPKGFTGTEPGEMVDIFFPASMNVQAITTPPWSWFRLWVRPKDGFSAEQVRQPMQAVFTLAQREEVNQLSSVTPRAVVEERLRRKLVLFPAAAGASGIQRQYRRPLLILAVLVALVLLIACANVSNLMTAQAAARAREMALRVSIGAGQWRLLQLVLMESLLLAAMASALGAAFASWSAPLVVAMLRVPQDPVRLALDPQWGDLAFGIALATGTALLFGLAPALRASQVKPMSTLRGGEDPHARRRMMHTLLAAQMAFCILVQFVAGLFVGTFQRLATRPLGFDAEHLLVMDGGAPKEQPLQTWMQAAGQIAATPGVRSVALAGWPLLERDRWSMAIRMPGGGPLPTRPWALDVSPGYFATMGIKMIDGREFRLSDIPPQLNAAKQPVAGAGIVNEAFARAYFHGHNPVGQSIELALDKDAFATLEIVGYVSDVVYAELREPMHPLIFLPQGPRERATFMVRTAADPRSMVAAMRRALAATGLNYQVRMDQAESEYLRWQMLTERLLAALSLFFAIVALLLAAIGLYGVLNYSVASQRREIGIRMALGARPGQIIRRATGDLAAATSFGAAIGLAGGIACSRFIESLLFEVKSTDAGAVAQPLLLLLLIAVAAAIPPALRAIRTDPAQTLRSE